MEVKDKIKLLLEKLNEGVYEKEEVIALSLLSSVAGESIFLLGSPGVAKSLVARRLKYAFKDGQSFEYLMNRFSTPDEIFGPVSISQLKDNDKYERIVENYLPTATVVFLDEIWKAGPSIQNALLTVLNEKIYRNGDQEIKVPIKALISASNELPSKGEGLEALWDRFLVRLIVTGIKDKQHFNDMISTTLNSYCDTIDDELKITNKVCEDYTNEIDKMEIPENIFNVIHVIRSYINQYNQKEENKEKQIYISDRRWRKVVRLLRTSAFLNDRKTVDLMDCFLIKHCLWNETEQIQTVSQFVNDAIQKHGYKLDIDLKSLREEIKSFENEINNNIKIPQNVQKERLKEYDKEYYKILNYDNRDNFYIKKQDYLLLKTKESQQITIYRERNQSSIEDYRRRFCKKQEKFKVNISSDYQYETNNYSLETETSTETTYITRKPHQATQKYWDKEVAKYLTTTNNLKHQISHFRETDLKHVRVNLFVNPELAEIVENNLIALEKEIDKIEIEVKQTQHYYENVEDQTSKTVFKALK